MADADPQLNIAEGNKVTPEKPQRKWLRILLMLSVPLLLIVGGVSYYLANDHYVSTDNAYVQQDKVSVST